MSISTVAQGHTGRTGIGVSRLPAPTLTAASHPIKLPGSALRVTVPKKELHFYWEVTK